MAGSLAALGIARRTLRAPGKVIFWERLVVLLMFRLPGRNGVLIESRAHMGCGAGGPTGTRARSLRLRLAALSRQMKDKSDV
jgi:hypothetical protein